MDLAIIKTGGKQYLTKKGNSLKVEKINKKEGEVVSFDTLLVANSDGGEIKIGKPKLSTHVKGKILKQGRTDKVLVVKYKPKTRYKKRVGHRQSYTQIQIQEI